MGDGAITLRPYQQSDAARIIDDPPRHAPSDSRWQVTAELNGEPIAAGGIALQWPDPGPEGYIGVAWFICKPNLPPRVRYRLMVRLRTLYYGWREDFSSIEMNCIRQSAGWHLARVCGMDWLCLRRKWLFGHDVTMYGWSKP